MLRRSKPPSVKGLVSFVAMITAKSNGIQTSCIRISATAVATITFFCTIIGGFADFKPAMQIVTETLHANKKTSNTQARNLSSDNSFDQKRSTATTPQVQPLNTTSHMVFMESNKKTEKRPSEYKPIATDLSSPQEQPMGGSHHNHQVGQNSSFSDPPVSSRHQISPNVGQTANQARSESQMTPSGKASDLSAYSSLQPPLSVCGSEKYSDLDKYKIGCVGY
jgi:hypothetical protein